MKTDKLITQCNSISIKRDSTTDYHSLSSKKGQLFDSDKAELLVQSFQKNHVIPQSRSLEVESSVNMIDDFNDNTFAIIESSEVVEVLDSLNIKKAPGLDGINNYILV
ncbi:hypothetical protein PVAND_011795 [Polypedilum vanderplanki]|uniref:Uncharacterized protein n=1 Tax=Polypedilum vanderplanki TaxID=319348 RepID=A0A9J6CLB3_POLVA|nr:hypothetical protein PVAND_011795 [Polypedilum vanderplanki]